MVRKLFVVLFAFATSSAFAADPKADAALLLAKMFAKAEPAERTLVLNLFDLYPWALATQDNERLLHAASKDLARGTDADHIRGQDAANRDRYVALFAQLRSFALYRGTGLLDFTTQFSNHYSPSIVIATPRAAQINLVQLVLLSDLLRKISVHPAAEEHRDGVEHIAWHFGVRLSFFLWATGGIEWVPESGGRVEMERRQRESLQRLRELGVLQNDPIDSQFLATHDAAFQRGLNAVYPGGWATYGFTAFLASTLQPPGVVGTIVLNLLAAAATGFGEWWQVAAQIVGVTGAYAVLLNQFQFRGHRWLWNGAYGPWVQHVAEPRHRRQLARAIYGAGCGASIVEGSNGT